MSESIDKNSEVSVSIQELFERKCKENNVSSKKMIELFMYIYSQRMFSIKIELMDEIK